MTYDPGCIQLYSGAMFNPFNPNVDVVTIKDIAHATSMQCRYGGHACQFYSVGEHSAVVAAMLREWGYSSYVQLQGLLHDCDEGLGLPDLPRPVKQQMPEYKKAGERIQEAVFKKFGLQWPMDPAVHVADNSVLFLKEKPALMGDINPEHWKYDGELRTFSVGLRFANPRQAYITFMATYQRLERELLQEARNYG